MGRISKKSLAAIIIACVWASIVLCLSMPLRPAVKAHAATMDDKILVWAESKYNVDGTSSSLKNIEWGTIYRGIKILSGADWEFDGSTGRVPFETYADATDEGAEYFIGNIDGDGGLAHLMDTSSDGWHVHDFTVGGDGSWESIDGDSHWAVCSECGLKFQVAHRLDEKGFCMDCGEDLSTKYASSYTFSGIPDYITNTPENVPSGSTDVLVVEFDEYGVAGLEISVKASILFGYTLSLNVACSGELTMTGVYSAPYTITVDAGIGETFDFRADNTEPQPIWTFTATEENIPEGALMAELDTTITVTLELSPEGDEGPAYSGTYLGSLTFSATLTSSGEEE